MSRARDASHVYVVADDGDQGAEDLTAEWSVDRRQRWISTPPSQHRKTSHRTVPRPSRRARGAHGAAPG